MTAPNALVMVGAARGIFGGPMLDLYTWTTPNGIKPLILLEELGMEYETHWVNIGKGQQFEEDYVRVNPNAKIPALVDDVTTVFESGAILIYLAEKAGKFLPKSGQERASTLSWLFFQVGGIGPMFGQLGWFLRASHKDPFAIERYKKETERLYAVLDKRLSQAPYLANEYSIADMATFGWAKGYDHLEITPESIPNVKKWIDRIAERPAVQRALAKKPPV